MINIKTFESRSGALETLWNEVWGPRAKGQSKSFRIARGMYLKAFGRWLGALGLNPWKTLGISKGNNFKSFGIKSRTLEPRPSRPLNLWGTKKETLRNDRGNLKESFGGIKET